MEFVSIVPHASFCGETNGGVVKNRLFALQASDALTCVAGVKRGRGRGNLGARKRVGRARETGNHSSLARGLAP